MFLKNVCGIVQILLAFLDVENYLVQLPGRLSIKIIFFRKSIKDIHVKACVLNRIFRLLWAINTGPLLLINPRLWSELIPLRIQRVLLHLLLHIGLKSLQIFIYLYDFAHFLNLLFDLILIELPLFCFDKFADAILFPNVYLIWRILNFLHLGHGVVSKVLFFHQGFGGSWRFVIKSIFIIETFNTARFMHK